MSPEYQAPTGTVWVCGACGRSGKDRSNIGDEACFLNAILCEDRLILPWKAVEGVSRWPSESELLAVGAAMEVAREGEQR